MNFLTDKTYINKILDTCDFNRHIFADEKKIYLIGA
jgi:hypothetical protein